jgi:hypothetical protein
MCVDCVLASLRITQADPGRRTSHRGHSITRTLTPRVPGNLAWRAYSAQSSSSGCPDWQGQSFEWERLDRHVHGFPLASPSSPTIEETSSSGLGVQWTPRPDSGNPRADDFKTSIEASRRNVPRDLHMAGWWAGAPLPHRDWKGPGNEPNLI